MRALIAKVLLIGVVSAITLGAQPTATHAGRLSADLEDRLLRASPDEFLPVMIRVTGGVPGGALKRQLAAQFRSRAERHRAAVESLQLTARTTQTPILQALKDPAFDGRVKDVRDFWIDNVITAQMTPTAAAEIASRVDVEEVYFLPPVEFYKSLSTPNLVSPAEAQVGSASPGCRAINADSAWRMGYTGKGRLVASLDTGVDGDHIFLRDKWRGNNGATVRESWFNPLTIDEKPRIFPGGGDDHGTLTMGIMVAIQDTAVIGDNTEDTVGVAFDAQWISAAVIDVGGANIIEALQWTADPDGDPNTELDVPDVVNNSWGSFQSDSECSDVFWNAIDNVEAAGAVMVFVAGNEGSLPMTIRNPGNRITSETNAFSVGMIDPHTAGFPIHRLSSRGPSDCDQATIKPEVVAPGVSIQTTRPGNSMTSITLGTSFAAPHVSGAVAILREYNPNATVDEIKLALMNSAVDLGAPGPDNTYGEGLIDVAAAIELLPPNDQPSLYIKHDYYERPAPGSSTNMVIVLRSSGPPVSNASVSVTSEDSRLTVLSGNASFGDFAAIGDTAGNFDAPFVLEVGAGVLEGERLAIRFVITGSGGYARTVLGAVQVGPDRSDEIFTHNAGNFKLSVSAQGTFGLSPGGLSPRAGGQGYLYGSDPESMFEGAFLVGIDDTHVSDNARDEFTFPDIDFQVDPGGWLDISEPGVNYTEETHAAFSDASAENPIGLFIEQRTLVQDDPDLDDYLIAEYTIHNRSGATIDGLRAGMYFDWDFGWGGPTQGSRDGGGFDAAEGVGWMRHRDQNQFRGVTVLSPPGISSYRYFVNAPEIYDGFSDEEKWLAMTGGTDNGEPEATGDGSHLVATGPYTLAPNEAITVAFAIIGATSEESMFASAESARDQYATGVVTVLQDSLSFAAVEGQANPASKPVTLTNKTLFAADFTVTNSELMSWMSVTPSSGSVASGGSVTLDVSVDITGLAEGSYPDSIIIEITGDKPGILRVSTTLTVIPAGDVWVVPTTLSFRAAAGGENPVGQTVTITSSKPLDAGFTVTNEAMMSWMSVMPLSGTVPSSGSLSLEITAEVGELLEGNYPDSIVIAIGDVEPETLRVNASLTVTPAGGVVSVLPASLAFTAPVGGENPPHQTVTITNDTPLDADFTVTSEALMSWMDVMPLSGTVPSVDSSSLDVIATVGGLSVGDYPGSILISIGDEEPETLRVNTALAVTPASEVRVSPNPFNPRKETVTMFVPLVHAGMVQASVYDITGEKVKDLPDASLQANSDSITWDGTTDDGDIVANGVYFCRIVGINVPFARTYTIVLKK